MKPLQRVSLALYRLLDVLKLRFEHKSNQVGSRWSAQAREAEEAPGHSHRPLTRAEPKSRG